MCYSLLYSKKSDYSCDIEKVVFVSKNFKALISLSQRLNTIIKDENVFFFVQTLYHHNSKDFYPILTKKKNDNNFYVDIDNINIHPDDLASYSLNDDEFISNYPIVTNPTKKQINQLCMKLFSFNDYERELSLVKSLK